jgi:hypothetical protein
MISKQHRAFGVRLTLMSYFRIDFERSKCSLTLKGISVSRNRFMEIGRNDCAVIAEI